MLIIINNLIEMRPRSSTIEADSVDEYIKKANEQSVLMSTSKNGHPLTFKEKKKTSSAPLNQITEADYSYEVDEDSVESKRVYKNSMDESLQFVKPRSDSELSENLLSQREYI